MLKIDLDAIDKPIDCLIEEQLSKLGYPICFGAQYPSILSNILNVGNPEEYFKTIFNIPKEQRSKIDVSIITDDPIFNQNKQYILTKETEKKLNEIKTELIDKHVKHLTKCIQCDLFEKCGKITTNYLLTVLIEEIKSNKEKRG